METASDLLRLRSAQPKIVDPEPEQYRKVLTEFEKTYYFNQGALHGLAAVLYKLREWDRESAGGTGNGTSQCARIADMLEQSNILR